ncbi:MAG TPA: glycosyltransferase family 2 protein [Candidatus Koribacter sp.]|jgi:glycosyltransferase involved in cell wall biosynthesis
MAFRKRIRRSYQRPIVTVIVPARNEEACLENCLLSLLGQEGIPFEVIVVDDGSTDDTRKIAESFHSVRVMSAPPLPENWCGKSNAVAFGARHARGDWFLFTDADTVHKPGSLARAVAEAERHRADLLSYSPEQVVKTFWEKAVMPVVFAELASTFKPKEVSDPRSSVAAANGQYLLVRRHAYELIGGHAAIAHTLLEDVDLARSIKEAGGRLFFRYGGDAVKTRMYRNFRQLREGWTKNLALLFPDARELAARRMLEFAGIVFCLAISTGFAFFQHFVVAAGFAGLTVAFWTKFLKRIRHAHFGSTSEIVSIFGLPMFAWLLRRSVKSYAKGAVTWKGRSYPAATERATKRVPEKTLN